MDEFQLKLSDLRIHGYHGVLEEERICGNEFAVNCTVSFTANKIKHLNDTINYVDVYSVIKDNFMKPTPLLETLAQHIVKDIFEMDERIKKVYIEIDKLSAPITNFSGRVGISLSSSKE